MTLTDLILPKRGIALPEMPSYIKLDMAFGLGSGTTLFDKSRYKSHGTISGASWASGAHGYCLDFDESALDHVEIPATHTQLNFTSEDFSLIARIRSDWLIAGRFIFNRRFSKIDGWSIRLTGDGKILVQTSQAGVDQQTQSSADDIVIDNWYTVGFSRSGASITLFKNGVDVTSAAGTHIDPASSTRSAYIGIYDGEAIYPWAGQIEFLRVFGGIALSASEHLAYHNALD
uniref:Putative lectin/glucanase superfamily protein n=1 Tax=viral metagenome TaxID=1070528 RepID=A0A6M3XWW3_9ZZZZ